jgi:TonB family protein
MSIGRALISILVVATVSVVFAQTTETKPPDVGSSGATDNQSSATAAPKPSGSKAVETAEILTDTMGVDFGPYLKGIVPIVKKNWYNMMPPSVYPPVLKQGKVSVEFVVLKDGKVNDMKLHTSSGDVPLDRAAWASITASSPFPPLPEEFPG